MRSSHPNPPVTLPRAGVRIPLLCAAVVASLAVVACGAPAPEVEEALAIEGSPTAGAEHYEAVCTQCHLGNLYLGDMTPSHSDEQIVSAQLQGIGQMPPQDVTAEDAADVLAYLRDRFGAFDESLAHGH